MTALTPYPELEWTPDLVERFWNYESGFPDHYFTHRKGIEIIQQVQRFLAPGAKVLDYGCGGGGLIDKLLDRGYETGGVDASSESIRALNSRLASHEKFLGAFHVEELARTGRTFDAIFVVEVIEHLYDAPLENGIETIRRLTGPGGIVILTTPNEEDLAKAQVFCPCCGKVFHRWQHVRSWSESGLRAYLESRGFEILHSFTTDFNARRVRRQSRRRLGKRLRALFRRERLALPRKPPHLAVICRPRSG